jgi:hypothetical protein
VCTGTESSGLEAIMVRNLRYIIQVVCAGTESSGLEVIMVRNLRYIIQVVCAGTESSGLEVIMEIGRASSREGVWIGV